MNRDIAEMNQQHGQLTAAEKELSVAIDELQRQLVREAKEQQAKIDRQAWEQELRDRNAKAAEAIRSAWEAAPGDAIGFMIGLNERGLYVARDEKGYYAAVEKSGFAHRLPDKDMQENR